jgi:hypothetical protein
MAGEGRGNLVIVVLDIEDTLIPVVRTDITDPIRRIFPATQQAFEVKDMSHRRTPFSLGLLRSP